MHRPMPYQRRWLAQVTKEYFAYHAVPTNLAAPRAFRVSTLPASGTAHSGGAARKTGSRGGGQRNSLATISLNRASCALGRTLALPFITQGKSCMHELCEYGSDGMDQPRSIGASVEEEQVSPHALNRTDPALGSRIIMARRAPSPSSLHLGLTAARLRA